MIPEVLPPSSRFRVDPDLRLPGEFPVAYGQQYMGMLAAITCDGTYSQTIDQTLAEFSLTDTTEHLQQELVRTLQPFANQQLELTLRLRAEHAPFILPVASITTDHNGTSSFSPTILTPQDEDRFLDIKKQTQERYTGKPVHFVYDFLPVFHPSLLQKPNVRLSTYTEHFLVLKHSLIHRGLLVMHLDDIDPYQEVDAATIRGHNAIVLLAAANAGFNPDDPAACTQVAYRRPKPSSVQGPDIPGTLYVFVQRDRADGDQLPEIREEYHSSDDLNPASVVAEAEQIFQETRLRRQ